MGEFVVLVDEKDNEVGTMDKLKAHEEGLLHRAFSILVFNSRNELLLQQRAKSKYHCGGLWTNTCCSHPRQGEPLEQAIHRRLKEEMGFDCQLKEEFSFIYKATFDNGLTEHELDHVFIGHYDADPVINKDEVEAFKWISLPDLREDMLANPEKYTPWFITIIERLKA